MSANAHKPDVPLRMALEDMAEGDPDGDIVHAIVCVAYRNKDKNNVWIRYYQGGEYDLHGALGLLMSTIQFMKE